MKRFFLFCGMVAFGSFAHAHSVWVEALTDGVVGIRFGEPDGKVETSPGRLDGVVVTQAFMIAKDDARKTQSCATAKQKDHFTMQGGAKEAVNCAVVIHDVIFPEGKPGRLPVFYARWAPSLSESGTPALTLDIVPTGKAGEARIYFKGKPLGGLKLTLHTPAAEKELEADAEGVVKFESATSGFHLLTIGRHSEPLAGFHGGKAYEVTSHNASLAWVQP